MVNTKKAVDSRKDYNPLLDPTVQLSSLGSMLSLAALLSDLIEYRGFAAQMVDGWARWVLPITEFVFAWIPSVFNIELTPSLLNYLTIFVLTFYGMLRYSRAMNFTHEFAQDSNPSFWSTSWKIAARTIGAFFSALFWPVVLGSMFVIILISIVRLRITTRGFLEATVMFLPVIQLGLLVGIFNNLDTVLSRS